MRAVKLAGYSALLFFFGGLFAVLEKFFKEETLESWKLTQWVYRVAAKANTL